MTVYKAVPGIDAVPLDDGSLLLCGDVINCRIEGGSAALVGDRLLPLLSEWKTAEAVKAELDGYPAAEVEALLGELAAAGILRERSASPKRSPAGASEAFGALGIDEGDAAHRLQSLRVGLIGLGTVGRLVASALAEAGVGTLLLADPGRQDAVAEALAASSGSRVEKAPPLDRAAVEAFAPDLDLMIVTVDRTFLAARHWANRASLASGRPALFADLSLTEALVGPTVLPGETSCYMCFRMRHLATLDRFAQAMAHERHLDALRDPGATRPILPGLAETAAGLIVGEAMRLLFGPLVPTFVNAIGQYEAVSGRLTLHELVRQPDCPHCRGIDSAVRTGA